MSELKGVAKSALVIIILTMGSKVLGFFREMVIAAGFGASYYTDAYVVALTIPAVLFASLSRSLQTTFIPVFNELIYREGKKQAFLFTSSVITIIVICLSLLSGLAYVFMPQITRVISPGFAGEVYRLTVDLARIMLPVGVVWGLTGLAGGILNSMHFFGVPAAVGIAYNLVIIVSVATLGHWWGIKGLAIGTALGVVSQFIIQTPWLTRVGVKWQPFVKLHYPALKKMGLLMIPIIVSNVVVQLNVVVDRLLASRLPEGSISALNFANRLNGFVLGIFVFAFVTVLFPILSQKVAAGEMEDFRHVFRQGLQIIIYLTVPATAIILILKVPIIRMLFERGVFDSRDTLATATAFLYYGVGMTAAGVREIINVAYYALQDTRTPVIVGIASLFLNILLNLILVRYMAHGGLALATSLSVTVYVILMLFLIHRKLKGINIKQILVTLTKVIIAAAVMALIMEIGKVLTGDVGEAGFVCQILYVGGLIGLGGAFYLLASFILQIKESSLVFKLVREQVKAKSRLGKNIDGR